eukprot:superscaffoldBa00000327_g3839
MTRLFDFYKCKFMFKCNVDSKVSRVAWLNRTTILFAGSEKWSLDPRVILMENTAVTEYSIKIQNVDVHDEGPYVCSILTNKKPKSTKVHLIVQGKNSNISFTKLREEQCKQCLQHELHMKAKHQAANQDPTPVYSTCKKWEDHKERAREDFSSVIASSNSGKVDVVEPQNEDIQAWEGGHSLTNLKNAPHLADMANSGED